MRKEIILTLLCGIFYACLFTACSRDFEGVLNEGIAPETYTVADTIIRFGDNRLQSEVRLQWWGDDADGFIAGYEFTFDAIVSDATLWNYTTAQDSTFILAPPAGEDSADYIFTIRAVDNSGLRDATPARLNIPVKNSPPTVIIIPGINNPVRTFPVLKFFWSGTDPDGIENLKQYELYFNDTTTLPYVLDKTISSAIFEATDAEAPFPVCNIYQNAATSPNAATMNGLITNAWNKLYIRAVDQSNAKSAFAVSDSVYVKKVNSNILMVDGYATTTNENFYATQISAAGFPLVDTVQIFNTTAGVYTQQSADNITQEKVFNLFDVIIWFSNDANNSFSLAQKTTGAFFNSGGKMLMSVYISSSFDPLSNFLDFTPIASLVDPIDTTLILDMGAQLIPVDIDYPTLEGTGIIGIVKPINLQIGATPLYNATLTAKDIITLTLSPWTGNSTVMAKKSDFAGNTNFVVSTLELQKLDGLVNMNNFFQKVLVDEFGL